MGRQSRHRPQFDPHCHRHKQRSRKTTGSMETDHRQGAMERPTEEARCRLPSTCTHRHRHRHADTQTPHRQTDRQAGRQTRTHTWRESYDGNVQALDRVEIGLGAFDCHNRDRHASFKRIRCKSSVKLPSLRDIRFVLKCADPNVGQTVGAHNNARTRRRCRKLDLEWGRAGSTGVSTLVAPTPARYQGE